jgi:glycosyltransferase involved in cell wall biosynthesis
MKKIINVAETLPGGVGAFLDEFNSGLKSKGFNVSAFVPDSHQSYISKDNVSEIFTYRRTGRNFKSFFLFISGLYTVLKRNNYDVLVLHSSFAGMMGRLLKPFFPNLKVIYYPHGVSTIMNVSFIKKNIYSFVERVLFYFFTDKVVAISKYEMGVLKNSKITGSDVCVIYNGIEDRYFESKREQTDVLNILFVGRFDKEKGLHVLLKALNKVTINHNLTIIGSFSSDVAKFDLDFPVDCNIINWLPREEMSNYYIDADVVVVPSEWEGLGLVAIEAISFCVPVFASNVGGLPEVVKDGFNGKLFEPGNYKELAELINKTTEKEYAFYRSNCRDHFLKYFSKERMISNFVDLVERL